MHRSTLLLMLTALILSLMVAGGCKKRYFPRITEEIIDEGVPVYEETVVE